MFLDAKIEELKGRYKQIINDEVDCNLLVWLMVTTKCPTQTPTLQCIAAYQMYIIYMTSLCQDCITC